MLAGAAWFKRVSAALQQDPGASYRRWIAALLPDLLRGSFNHDARTEVFNNPSPHVMVRCASEHRLRQLLAGNTRPMPRRQHDVCLLAICT